MLINYPKFQAFNNSGAFLSGGKLYTYAAGSTDPKTTYSNPTCTTPNTNPVVFNARGEASVYGVGSYKLVLKDASDVTVWTVDNYELNGVPGSVKEVYPDWWAENTTPGTTDMTAAIQAAANACNRIMFTANTYRITAPIYFDYAGHRSYILEGQGPETVIDCDGFSDGDYVFYANETSAGAIAQTYPILPRLVLRNMKFDATNSSTPDFCYVRNCCVNVSLCHFNDFDNGFVTGSEYCDNSRFEHCKWNGGTTTGYFYSQTGFGDNTLLDQIHCGNSTGEALHDTGLAKFVGTTSAATCGAKITNCIGGKIYLERSPMVIIDNWHVEDVGLGNRALYAKNSQVFLKHSSIWNNYDPATAPIYLSGDGYNYLYATFEDNSFVSYLLPENYRKAANVDIQVDDVSDTKDYLVLRNNVRVSCLGPGWSPEVAAIKIGSNVAALNNAVALLPGKRMLADNVKITKDYYNWYVMQAPPARTMNYISYPKPAIAAITVPNYYNSTLTAQTYYYRAAIYFDDSLHTQKSDEVSQLATADKAIQFNVVGVANSMLRIWRGSTTDTYDAYADISFASGRINLRDCGDHINGHAWIEADIPNLPADNTTMPGELNPYGNRIFYAAAAPTSSEFTGAVGDIVWDCNAASGAPPGWYCTKAGSPGTWKAMANLA